MNWKALIAIVLIAIIACGALWYFTQPRYPSVANVFQYRYRVMANDYMKSRLHDFTKYDMEDAIAGLDYVQLLEWQHRYMVYPASDPHKIVWQTKVNLEGRPYDSIEILDSRFMVYVPEDGRDKVMGKCQEFALVYICSLLANDIECRIVVDCSAKTDNRTAGDHVFVQVWVNGSWLHCDPTEKRIGDPYMYVRDWKKNVNLVYAITAEEIVDVTKDFIPP